MQIELTENEIKILVACSRMACAEGYYLFNYLEFNETKPAWNEIGIELKSVLTKLGLEEYRVNSMWEY